MKVLCNTEFYHSGVRLYSTGAVYELSKENAEQLIGMDTKKELGALSFFTPVDEDAVNYFAGKKKGSTTATSEQTTTTPPVKTEAQEKLELVAKAKQLGIQGTSKMSVEELKKVIEAAEKPTATSEQTTTTPQG